MLWLGRLERKMLWLGRSKRNDPLDERADDAAGMDSQRDDELVALAAGKQRLTVLSGSDGRLVAVDECQRAIGRLRALQSERKGVAPLETWEAETHDGVWHIIAEGSRRSWRFAMRRPSSYVVVASAMRHRWRLGVYDVWIAPGHWHRLQFSTFRVEGMLSDAAGNRIARLDCRPIRSSVAVVDTFAHPTPGPAPSLLLLALRIGIFDALTRVGGEGSRAVPRGRGRGR
jgi:hypothetical protein